MASNGCKFELIDDGRLRVCSCDKKECSFLGGGGYSKVYKATASQGIGAVAIKCPRGECHVDYEIATLQKVDHRNILKYYGEFKWGPNRYLHFYFFSL